MLLSKMNEKINTKRRSKKTIAYDKVNNKWLIALVTVLALSTMPQSVKADSVDVIPPTGSISIKNSTMQDGVPTVTSREMQV